MRAEGGDLRGHRARRRGGRRCCGLPPPRRTCTTLDEYIGRMPEGQEAIYYLAGWRGVRGRRSRRSWRGLRGQGVRGAAAVGPDRRVLAGAAGHAYKEKRLKSVPARPGSLFAAGGGGRGRSASLCDALAAALGDKVSGVAASTRLSGSPAMLVAAEHGPGPGDAAAAAAGRDGPVLRPAAEAGDQPDAPAGAWRLAQSGRSWAARTRRCCWIWPKLQEGDLPENPAAFVRAVAGALAR